MKNSTNRKLWGYTFVYPIFITISALVIGVLIYNIIVSFQDNRLIGGSDEFVGLQTYQDMFDRRETTTVILNSLKFNLVGAALTILLGLGAALILSEKIKGFRFIRGTMLMPWVMPGVIVAGVWKWMLNSNSGIINQLLVDIGILNEGFAWLGNINTALFSVNAAIIWRLFPIFALVMIAGIHGIDEQLYESARIDGANKWQEIWFITLPGIKYQILTMSVLCLIWISNNLVLVNVMTDGGPIYYSSTLPLFIYKLGIQFGNLSQASAATMINFLMLLAFSITYLAILTKNQKRQKQK
jgi:multiple sugar transport system permease protein